MAREIKGVANLVNQTKEAPVVDQTNTDTGVTPAETTTTTTTRRVKTKTINKVAKELEEDFEKKRAKKTMEQTHTRTTVLLKRELADKLNELSATKGRGFKTEFINKAISELLKQF